MRVAPPVDLAAEDLADFAPEDFAAGFAPDDFALDAREPVFDPADFAVELFAAGFFAAGSFAAGFLAAGFFAAAGFALAARAGVFRADDLAAVDFAAGFARDGLFLADDFAAGLVPAFAVDDRADDLAPDAFEADDLLPPDFAPDDLEPVFLLAIFSNSFSLIDAAICFDAPRRLLLGVSPRLADRAAPAALRCAGDLAGIVVSFSAPERARR